MRFAGFLPLLIFLASYYPADGIFFDDAWKSWKTFDSKMDRQAKLTENLAKIIENQSKDIEELKAELNKTQMSNAAIEVQLKKHSSDLLIHDSRLKSHTDLATNWSQIPKCIQVARFGARDCVDIRVLGCTESGVYTIFPDSSDKRIKVEVFCEFGNNKDNWLVFQRRKDGSVDFERTWAEYERGFGDLNGEFWLGNEALALITTNRKYKLRVELEDFSGQKRYAEYSTFSVRPASEKYRLTVTGYSGNAGDSLSYHNGMKFSTKDADNDKLSAVNCAITYRGAWWHDACHWSNLNGHYLRGKHTSRGDGINWHTWQGFYYSLKTTEMKITRVA